MRIKLKNTKPGEENLVCLKGIFKQSFFISKTVLFFSSDAIESDK